MSHRARPAIVPTSSPTPSTASAIAGYTPRARSNPPSVFATAVRPTASAATPSVSHPSEDRSRGTAATGAAGAPGTGAAIPGSEGPSVAGPVGEAETSGPATAPGASRR